MKVSVAEAKNKLTQLIAAVESILSKTTCRVIEDPFDRMLIATALAEDVPIVTTDRQLRRYRGLRVLS